MRLRSPVYATETSAWARVATLIPHGIWPGIYRVKGGWALTYDPVIAEEEFW